MSDAMQRTQKLIEEAHALLKKAQSALDRSAELQATPEAERAERNYRQTVRLVTDKERKEDAARHRALAAVHEAAAKCLESGKSEKDCQEKLKQDCKGLGIGKYCGMRHKH